MARLKIMIQKMFRVCGILLQSYRKNVRPVELIIPEHLEVVQGIS
jgi:hypothetical protein